MKDRSNLSASEIVLSATIAKKIGTGGMFKLRGEGFEERRL